MNVNVYWRLKGLIYSAVIVSALSDLSAVAAPQGCEWPQPIPVAADMIGVDGFQNGLYILNGDPVQAICVSVTETTESHFGGGLVITEWTEGVFTLTSIVGGVIQEKEMPLSKYALHQCLNDVRKLYQDAGFAYPVKSQ